MKKEMILAKINHTKELHCLIVKYKFHSKIFVFTPRISFWSWGGYCRQHQIKVQKVAAYNGTFPANLQCFRYPI